MPFCFGQNHIEHKIGRVHKMRTDEKWYIFIDLLQLLLQVGGNEMLKLRIGKYLSSTMFGTFHQHWWLTRRKNKHCHAAVACEGHASLWISRNYHRVARGSASHIQTEISVQWQQGGCKGFHRFAGRSAGLIQWGQIFGQFASSCASLIL